MNIEESNRMIAEFMGGVLMESATAYNFGKSQHGNYIVCDISHLEYHTSWDWLMPVGKKLMMCRIEPPKSAEEFYVFVDLVEAITSFDIELAYREIVSVVKWYNENYKP